MNIAEDVRHAFMIEAHPFCASSLIKPQIESLPIELRKDVVKERVEIWEFDCASQWHDKQVRRKAFVLLCHAEVTRWRRVSRGAWFVRNAAQPQNSIRRLTMS